MVSQRIILSNQHWNGSVSCSSYCSTTTENSHITPIVNKRYPDLRFSYIHTLHHVQEDQTESWQSRSEHQRENNIDDAKTRNGWIRGVPQGNWRAPGPGVRDLIDEGPLFGLHHHQRGGDYQTHLLSSLEII